MFLLARPKPRVSTPAGRDLVHLRMSRVLILSTILVACSGCGDPKAPATPQAGPTPVAAAPAAGPTTSDPLADVLRLAKAGNVDAAIQRLVTNAPDNWFESTSLEEFRLSEADLAALGSADRSRLQQQFIDRVGEIKGFARTVMDRAKEAKKRGDAETAQRYTEAVHGFGRQLLDSKTVTVFQLTGKALANMTLSE